MKSVTKKKNILRFKRNVIFVSILFTFHFSLFIFTVTAFHTYHTSLTRIDYNEKEKLAEISIQMFHHDLVPVLENRTKKRIDLEKTSDVNSIILKYLAQNFVLRDESGEVKKLVWVGKEMQADTIFVYVEIPLEKDFAGFDLQNTLFFESFPEQTNFVIARFNHKKADLLFKVGDKFKQIKAINTSEEKK